jgi:hypothetical protein
VGASQFETYRDGTDVHVAFQNAVDAAAWEHGHGGYSGTIAEKDDFVVVTQRPMSYDGASRLASDLLARDDPRVADKWGPAGAIPIRQASRTVSLDNLPTPALGGSPARQLARISRIARDRGLMTDAETATDGHRLPGDGFSLTVTKDPAALAEQTEPDGWLFFGFASS